MIKVADKKESLVDSLLVDHPLTKSQELKTDVLKEIFQGSRFQSMKELTEINNIYFVKRLFYFLLIVGIGVAGVIYGNIFMKIISIIILGGMYAHAIELQHQALHYTAFRSKRLNRFVGVILGIPMLVSFTDYQVHHWAHHKNLGTPANKEFFNYNYDKLRSLSFMIPHLFMVYHYADVAKFMLFSLINKKKDNVTLVQGKKIQTEYIIMLFVVSFVVGLSIYFESTLAIYLWALPLVFAIPLHALIELPEHLGCPQLSVNPFENTRTIQSSWFGKWFTNANNYHVEHHFLPGVPNDKVEALHEVLKPRIAVLDKSFTGFYAWFIKALINKGEFYKPKNI